MTDEEQYTDECGVTYSSYGRVLKEVNPQLFTCDEYVIPEGVEVLEGDFFFKNTKLRKITLPGTLRKMEANAFIHCLLENLELPEGITEVPEYMCECCRTLKKVVLPSTIKKILTGAFNGCCSLEEVNLPEGIEFIDESTFRLCEPKSEIICTQIRRSA